MPVRNGIVVFMFSRVGDFVRCHTLVQLIRTRYPDEPIDVVARHPGIGLAPLVPEVRAGIVEHSLPGRLTWPDRVRLVRQLRRSNYRAAYIVSRSWKAALVPCLAGIPQRVGWFGEGRVGLINDLRLGDRSFPRLAEAAAMLGLDRGACPLEPWPPPRLVVPEASKRAWRETRGARQRPVLALAPGASFDPRRWPAERYAELARWAVTQGWDVVLTGSAGERPLGAHIVALAGCDIELVMGDSVMDLAQCLDMADAFVGNDSGPLHIAAALGKPCVGVYGLSLASLERPFNQQVRIVEASGAPRSSADPARVWEPKNWPGVEAVKENVLAAMLDATAAARPSLR
jgi:heptosyltransferase II